jgi:hypothetical protein
MQIHIFWWLVLLSPTAMAVTTATVKQSTPLLAQPNPAAATLTSLKAAEPVTVLTRQGGWYQVTPPEKATGWLRLFNVQFVKGRYQPDNLPLQELTGLLKGSQQQVTSSTGVRGLDKVAIANAKPNFDSLQQLQRFQQSVAQAQDFANKAQLKADSTVPLRETNQ